jgi:hypothetical protein
MTDNQAHPHLPLRAFLSSVARERREVRVETMSLHA